MKVATSMYCTNCGKNNTEESKFCEHCGANLKHPSQSHHTENHHASTLETEDKRSRTESVDANVPPYPYAISITKLIVLSVVTFGVYEIYWFYKHFKSFKSDREWKITPWIRALFAGFTSHSLFKQVSEAVKEFDQKRSLKAGGLATAFFILNTLWRLPDPYWLLSVLTFLPLIPVQNTINYYWEKRLGNKLVRSNFGAWNYIWMVVGSVVVALALLGTFGSNFDDLENQNIVNNTDLINIYPAQMIKNYMSSCIESSGGEEYQLYCSCTIEKLQKLYTVEQFTGIEEQYNSTNKLPPEFQSVINTCSEELLPIVDNN